MREASLRARPGPRRSGAESDEGVEVTVAAPDRAIFGELLAGSAPGWVATLLGNGRPLRWTHLACYCLPRSVPALPRPREPDRDPRRRDHRAFRSLRLPVIGIGGLRYRRRPCRTTRHAGPHRAVRELEVMRAWVRPAGRSRQRSARSSAGGRCRATSVGMGCLMIRIRCVEKDAAWRSSWQVVVSIAVRGQQQHREYSPPSRGRRPALRAARSDHGPCLRG